MSGGWEDADRLKAALPLSARASRRERGEMCAFIEIAGHRYATRRGDKVILKMRPCYYVPKKWRYCDSATVTQVERDNGCMGLTPAQRAAVLVARDEWLAAGGKRLHRVPKKAAP